MPGVEAGALALCSVSLGFLFQIAATIVGLLLARPYSSTVVADFQARHVSHLLETDHGLGDYLMLLGHNLLALAGFVLAALLLVGWQPSRRLPLRRRVGVLISLCLLAYTFGTLAVQSGQLMSLFEPLYKLNGQTKVSSEASRAMLPLCLPHGPLEFGGLLLPLLTALRARGARTVRPVRSVLLSVGWSSTLLAIAAVIETWISPVLLSMPVNGIRPG